MAHRPHSDTDFKVNKVTRYFKLVESYKVESEADRKRYNRAVEKLRLVLVEPGTSADLIHRAALAYTHYMVTDAVMDKMIADGQRAVSSGKYKLLYAYFAGALKKHLLSSNIELGACRTNKQIAQDGQRRFGFGNRDLSGQTHFRLDQASVGYITVINPSSTSLMVPREIRAWRTGSQRNPGVGKALTMKPEVAIVLIDSKETVCPSKKDF